MQLTHLSIKNYRGIKSLDLALDETTVLIGENNSGKTTILHALRACLQSLRNSGRSVVFDEFDFHFESSESDPSTAEPIEILLTFEEGEEEWTEEIERHLGGDAGIIMFIEPQDKARVQLKVTSEYSAVTQEIETSFDFLDAEGNALTGKSRSKLAALQQVRPLFYLSALRDAGKEFSRTAQFWSPFVKNSQITPEKKQEIERQLVEINSAIIDAHGTFKDVQLHLSKVQELVSVGDQDVVSVDAIPARIFDMLSRTQVNIASATGARLPIARHGEGTQSLTVLMLFDAFLQSDLAKKQGVHESRPIVALEEPEAHLHPTAIRALWKTISKINGQKIIATHSGDLLSEVDPFSIRRLYRSGGEVKVGQLPSDLFHTNELQKFEYWVSRTRGELFFAKTWILVEGETDIILLSGAAKALKFDLEQYGVRLVEYAQSDLSVFLNAANSLGIAWYVFSDGDAAGQRNIDKAKHLLQPNRYSRHIGILPDGEPVEPFLCKNGFISIYEERAAEQKKTTILTVGKNEPEYAVQIAKCLPKNGKPGAAHAVVSEMLRLGAESVPKIFRFAIYKAAALGRRKS